MPWYNLLMAGVDAAVLVYLVRNRRVGAVAMAAVAAGGAAMLLAGMLGRDAFGVMRLLACGLFVHAVVLLFATALLFWRVRRALAVACLATGAVGVGVGVQAFWIEPTWLEVTHRRIVSPKIHQSLRIVVLADLQTDQFGPYERRVLDRVLEEKPDLILLAGDYIQADRPERLRLAQEINAYLHEIKFDAPLGVLAVLGNVDGDVAELFDGLPVQLVRRTETIAVGPLDVSCLALYDSFETELAVDRPEADRFHVVLGHSPNFAMGQIDAELLVAGHTHGGQVRLPGVGPLLTLARVPRGWAAGMTELDGGRRLLVSRGVGMERGRAPRMRFLCRPELAVIDLVPE